MTLTSTPRRSVWRLAAQNTTVLAAADGHVRASPVSVCVGAAVRTCAATVCSLVFDHGAVLPRGNHTAGEIVYNAIASCAATQLNVNTSESK